MPANTAIRPDFSSRLSFWMLSAFLVVLWVAGGASRADVSGQGVVRFFAWSFLIAFALFSTRFDWRRVKPIVLLLGLIILLVGLQLVPLPPAIWTALPDRELLVEAAEVSGQAQPWRPWSISPGATANALGSLVVPVTVLVLAAQLTRDQQWRVAAVLLALVFAGSLVALLQFSGAKFGNPLVNYQAGAVSGMFANRNHFALFLSFGCLLAPIWGFRETKQAKLRATLSIGIMLIFLLVALASGSRSGIILTAAGALGGIFLIRAKAARELRSLPRWATFSIPVVILLILAGVVILSFILGRAIAVDRAIVLEADDDLRSKAFPYVIENIVRYFPTGTGFGAFDPVYRIGEPDALLQPAYFNHAHNDWLEILLDGGLAGGVMAIAIVGWVVVAAVRAWRGSDQGSGLARAGSLALVLTMLASLTDYPSRTPLIMAIIVIAAVWLHSESWSSSKTHAMDQDRR